VKIYQLKVMGFELVRADQISVQDLAEKKGWRISSRLLSWSWTILKAF